MSKDGAPNFKTTLNLPSTRFPMRGNLPGREPEILATWAEERVYERVLEALSAGEGASRSSRRRTSPSSW